MTELPATHMAMVQSLGMALWKYYLGEEGQGGGRSVVNIPLLILYEEKYPEIVQSGLAAVVRYFQQRQRSV